MCFNSLISLYNLVYTILNKMKIFNNQKRTAWLEQFFSWSRKSEKDYVIDIAFAILGRVLRIELYDNSPQNIIKFYYLSINPLIRV